MLTASQLAIGYNGKALLEDVNIEFGPGKLSAIIGLNGSGKTTLLKTLVGWQSPMKGCVAIDGLELSQISPKELAKLISVVPTGRPFVQHMTVEQLIAMGRLPYTNWMGTMSQGDKMAIREVIEAFELIHLRDKMINAISDGEMQKALIAKAFAQDTRFIVLDEPTAHLDILQRKNVFATLKEMTMLSGKGVVVATHEIDLATQYADSFVLMGKDRISQTVDKAEVLRMFAMV